MFSLFKYVISVVLISTFYLVSVEYVFGDNAVSQEKNELAAIDGGHKEAENEKQQIKSAIFAGGCFWCMQPAFDSVKGVLKTVVGYAGGKVENPSYELVSSGQTKHAEAIHITYDSGIIGYESLLNIFWRNIDPLASNRQFCDVGYQYRSAIFAADATELKTAIESKKKLEKSGRFSKPIATQIIQSSTFYPAEDYHQNYYKKNPVRYKFYRYSCGRDARLKELWSK